MESERPLLAVDLSVDFPSKPHALRRVSFEIRRGEVLGLVGESGSGKSTIAMAILRLLGCKGGKVTGRLMFRGHDLLAASEREMRHIRGREIALVLQSPLASLNPALRIGTQLAESWNAHAKGTKSDAVAAIEGVLARVGLPQDREFRDRYPSQISVGQAQRVLIAIAIMHSPALLIADEPTSALDVITQAETKKLFAELNCNMGSALLYISHDLGSVASVSHRIAILHNGEIVECGNCDDVLARPAHPYTQQLLACVPWVTKPIHSVAKAVPPIRNFPKAILPAPTVSRGRPLSTLH
jgi:ABC-type dipeptide/oligopeptide/nickel transport system ATPase component